MNIGAYLERIRLSGAEIGADAESLRLLQRSHLLSVPFENLDIHWQRPIVIDTARFWNKIVNERRGGFCYELNGLFNELLLRIGFTTRLVSARVFDGTQHGPEYGHAAIIVTIGEDEYLADVGFGNFTVQPLRFILDEEQIDSTGTFVIRRFDDEYFETAKRDGDEWKRLYIFKDIPHDLSEFAEMCDFHQFSPESHFTKSKVCSIMTENGRKTLMDNRMIVTNAGSKNERVVESETVFYSLL